MNISESHASHIGRVGVDFCLSGDELDPTLVTSTIGITPSLSARRGDARLGPEGKQAGIQCEDAMLREEHELSKGHSLLSRTKTEIFSSIDRKCQQRCCSFPTRLAARGDNAAA